MRIPFFQPASDPNSGIEDAKRAPGQEETPVQANGPDAADSGEEEIVEVPIEDAIDLHFFAPRDVRAVVEEYLEQAAARGFREVRIIHGRGIGEIRRQVHDILRRHPLVERFAEAPAGRGGWGATLAWLRPAPPPE